MRKEELAGETYDTAKVHLEDALSSYAASDMYRFHMPGHKGRGPLVHQIDITEIDGFDNLHNPEGVLRDEMRRAADFYGTKETFFLVNGSTVGILTAISATVPFGGTILIERGCHISVYHAAYLRRLKVRFVEEMGDCQAPAEMRDGSGSETSGGGKSQDGALPETAGRGVPQDGNLPEEAGRGRPQNGTLPETSGGGKSLSESLPAADALVITSPTYEGNVKDVAHWAAIAHARGIPLIVDEAHGAHFSLHPYFPESAVRLGADLVIQSTHKTLPAMTQTALLHNVTGRVDGRMLQRFLDIYETSSPSYVLMASVTQALHVVMEAGPAYFNEYAGRLKALRTALKGLRHLTLADPPGSDPGKFVIRTGNLRIRLRTDEGGSKKDHGESESFFRPLTGPVLYDLLREKYHLQPEMKAPDYVLLMTSVSDTEEGFKRLVAALKEIDEQASADPRADAAGSGIQAGACLMAADSEADGSTLTGEGADGSALTGEGADGSALTDEEPDGKRLPPHRLELYEAYESTCETVSLKKAAGRICADFVILYPPDAPLLIPGELCTEELLQKIRTLKKIGLTVTGAEEGIKVTTVR